MYELYGKLIEKEKYFRSQGYNMVSMWSHEWADMKKYNKEVKQFIESYTNPCKALNMRDAFFGGMTQPTKMLQRTKSGQKIRYVDFTSLYPSVQYGVHRGLTKNTYNQKKILEYPVGHPDIITNPEELDAIKQDLMDGKSDIFGFIHCSVRCPKDLFHPVLPQKKNGKLLFDLDDKTGTWTTVEVQRAVEKGYIIDEVFEVYHFKRRSSELFKGYVSTFLKVKQEAAGWKKLTGNDSPSEQSKDEYVDRYAENQGIQLDKNNIGSYNAGMYYIAKLCLNSLWGKFAQRDNLTKCEDIFDSKRFRSIVYDDRYDIVNVIFHNCRARSVQYRYKTDCAELGKNTNIAIAAFTTAHARLRLNDVIDALGDKVLYMDTDSCIYVDDGTTDLVCGDFLGDLTDELGSGDYITDFCSTGPKSYAYKTHQGKSSVKVKGITLNTSTEDLINFETIKNTILKHLEGETVKILTKPLQFEISNGYTIRTRKDYTKVFRYTFDKRQIGYIDDYEIRTVPIGYCVSQACTA